MVLSQAFTAQKPVVCDNAPKTMEMLAKDFNERPVFMAQGAESTVFVITVNTDNGSWSALETQENNLICLLANGKGYKINGEIMKELKVTK